MVRLHRILVSFVNSSWIQLTVGFTLFIYTLVDQEQTALHHGVRFLVIWRAIPDVLQALERITRGLEGEKND